MTQGREFELLGRLEGLIAQIDRLAVQAAREDADRDAQREEAARTGALGPDWQEVQRRIDDGETSLREVFAGADDSPAAVRLREQANRNLSGLAEQLPVEVTEEIQQTDDEWRRLRNLR